MSKRLLGTPCKISPYRNNGCDVQPGHFLRTNAGSCYEILEARFIGGDSSRLSLNCLRVDPGSVSADAIIHSLFWDRRAPSLISEKSPTGDFLALATEN